MQNNVQKPAIKEKYQNYLVPFKGQVQKIIRETDDIKTFHVSSDGGKPFIPLPGQLAMLSLPGIGEAMFSVSSQEKRHLEFSIKKTGILTDMLHEISEGQAIGIRGPYGNGFPLEMLKGKDLLFVAGGIGLAPIRSLINHCLGSREDFGKLWLIYGSRTPPDLCFKEEIYELWPSQGMRVDLTVDEGDDSWSGPVGFVPAFLESLAPPTEDKIVIVCGPPLMIRFALQSLDKLGFVPEKIITTLEKRMKCGIGLCGRCNLGSKYVCLDGPVFTVAELGDLPPEL
ncbi:MAG: FAD/NAD(P)-binding protein [Dethiobacteria bacterium]